MKQTRKTTKKQTNKKQQQTNKQIKNKVNIDLNKRNIKIGIYFLFVYNTYVVDTYEEHLGTSDECPQPFLCLNEENIAIFNYKINLSRG